MRLLLLHSSSDIYGASKIFLQTVALLRNRGHECTVVLSGTGPLQMELEKVVLVLKHSEMVQNIKFIQEICFGDQIGAQLRFHK